MSWNISAAALAAFLVLALFYAYVRIGELSSEIAQLRRDQKLWEKHGDDRHWKEYHKLHKVERALKEMGCVWVEANDGYWRAP